MTKNYSNKYLLNIFLYLLENEKGAAACPACGLVAVLAAGVDVNEKENGLLALLLFDPNISDFYFFLTI